MKFVEITKSFSIPKKLVMQAYQVVKANKGSHGIDQQSLANFEKNWRGNLYKLWNRMSSGTYFPRPVRRVAIPKKTGGERSLGIPTIEDRIASTVVKLALEPELEKHFHSDSYGYRPSRSALDAVTITRERCRTYDWVIEFDIQAMFDTISWDLLMKNVKHHTDCRWIILYIERLLRAPMQEETGKTIERTSGAAQGSPLSPLLANLFMHYAFDVWVSKKYPNNPFCRFADDGLVHCRSEQEAQGILKHLEERLADCGLKIHPGKTRIVYCKDGKRRKKSANWQFDFLGYTFRPRLILNTKNKSLFVSFSPAVSNKSLKGMRQEIRKSNIRNRSELSLQQIATIFNPILRGWLQYYGRHHEEALEPMCSHFNMTLVAWARRKYKRLQKHKTKACQFIQNIKTQNPRLFEHWKTGIGNSFA
jgi:RNA-directed DNA polymerase